MFSVCSLSDFVKFLLFLFMFPSLILLNIPHRHTKSGIDRVGKLHYFKFLIEGNVERRYYFLRSRTENVENEYVESYNRLRLEWSWD